jgi:hypothetical protein
MKKRLILAGLGVVVVLVGVAAFAANTAQWVNVTAHVEKEIAVACVDDSITPPEVTDCDFGTVFPQNVEQRVVEVAISNSFTEQTTKSDITYWVLWECKLVDEAAPAQPDPTLPGYNPCRENLPATDPLHLDGNIRDYIEVTGGAGCLNAETFPEPAINPAELKGIGDGTIDRTVTTKCFYHLRFTPPACAGAYNPNTDPAPAAKVVTCNVNEDAADPQEWDVSTDLGDIFKIQVNGFSFD